ncbi:MAG: helix-turn-helix domain-containing protein [Chloroflexota bacterium]|nr:helix-turn-helix domain-containing protein [Chloroflexota bacterium]
MQLTGRQRDCMSTFLDLYREAQGPLHYTTVAQRLGVSKITAYDMLRLLEERGLVESEYVLRGEGQGAGRSRIVFRPTPEADALFDEVAGEGVGQGEWEAVKTRTLEALQAGKDTDYEGLLKEIVTRLPQRESPMLYAAEMITAVILSLRQLREDASAAGLFDKLRPLGLPDEHGLSALAGLTLGLSFVERINRRLIGRLVSYTDRYQEILSRLSAENKRRLSDFVGELMQVFEA